IGRAGGRPVRLPEGRARRAGFRQSGGGRPKEPRRWSRNATAAVVSSDVGRGTWHHRIGQFQADLCLGTAQYNAYRPGWRETNTVGAKGGTRTPPVLPTGS